MVYSTKSTWPLGSEAVITHSIMSSSYSSTEARASLTEKQMKKQLAASPS